MCLSAFVIQLSVSGARALARSVQQSSQGNRRATAPRTRAQSPVNVDRLCVLCRYVMLKYYNCAVVISGPGCGRIRIVFNAPRDACAPRKLSSM